MLRTVCRICNKERWAQGRGVPKENVCKRCRNEKPVRTKLRMKRMKKLPPALPPPPSKKRSRHDRG
jgi:hypothetical protein